jgi:hypothetical protein
MSALRTAALVAVLLALPACKDLNGGMNLLQGLPEDAKPAALAAFDPPAAVELVADPEPTPDPAPAPDPEPPRFTVLDPAGGPMGEEIATGVDCHPSFRVRICV